MRRPLWVALGGLGLALALSSVSLASPLGRLVKKNMDPGVPFDAEAPPRAPDYADPAAWSALPEREDLADRAPAGEPVMDQRLAPVDVFYIHPTSYVEGHYNGPIDDAKLNDATDRVATGIQASAFSGCCALYAPRYRQSNGLPFLVDSPEGERAVDLAYDDVLRAFRVFLDRTGDRPFILAGHSQGSVLGERLLAEQISGSPLRDRLVAAYLPGGRITVEGLAEEAPDLPPCASPTQTGCVTAWNARRDFYEPSDMELRRTDLRERLCTNPLTWRLDGARAGAELNLGGVFLETDDHAPKPGIADAQCEAGTLVVRELQRLPRDLMSRILDRVLGRGNLHPVEYQIYFMNLRRNAADRIAAFEASRAAGDHATP